MTVEIVQSQALVALHHPAVVLDSEFGVVAVCTHPTVAARVAQLWERHGLADVPDTPEAVTG